MADIKNLKVDLKNKILSSNEIVILPHKFPDFDALGSAAGLAVIATKLRKESCVSIIVDNPLSAGASMMVEDMKKSGYNIIGSNTFFKNKGALDFRDLFILTDVNEINRVPIEIHNVPKEKIVIIDHHEKSRYMVSSSVKYIDSKRSSACEIVAKLLCQYNIKYEPKLANYLLTGIYLDTDKLKRVVDSDNRIYPDTLNIVNKLKSKYKANTSEVNKYFIEDFLTDRKIHSFINRTKFIGENKEIGLITGYENEEFKREELAKAVDYLLNFHISVAFVIGRLNKDFVAISMRAKSNNIINIVNIAKEFGGGGNNHSAAATISGLLVEDVEKKLVKMLPQCSIFVEN